MNADTRNVRTPKIEVRTLMQTVVSCRYWVLRCMQFSRTATTPIPFTGRSQQPEQYSVFGFPVATIQAIRR